ncbi:DNA topoisomerase IB [Pseudofrancisella aestuarii]|uniref:DNA topoisomerase n=1 Tax=Pseudofrancisella aestuarii TaxID=2670347 RepID=A0ABV9TAD4_9GAMM|nr:DNA topoisomerase IB [Pseudofrancisella aestuarii]
MSRYNKRIAKKANLEYIEKFKSGYKRVRKGSGFAFYCEKKKLITSDSIKNKIKDLTIPPAWENVWVCKKSNGHIQATGYDEQGRKQYIYHPKWVALQHALKYEHLLLFSQVLPRIRSRVDYDLKRKRLCKKKVIAASIRLLDKSHIRVGNIQYQIKNKSRGLTTLSKKNVDIDDISIYLHFKGKSKVDHKIRFTDARLAEVLQECQGLEGQFLFSYYSNTNVLTNITSTNINRYLRRVARSYISAKDYRTWWANVSFIDYIRQNEKENEGKLLKQAIEYAAKELGNTPNICKESYLHPSILEAYEQGLLPEWIREEEKKYVKTSNYMYKSEQLFTQILIRLG